MKKTLLLLAVALAVSAAAAACGKRPDKLAYPEGQERSYPRSYPSSK